MSVELQANGTEIRVEGEHYLDVLRRAHAALQPRGYFEIGTLHGDTLRLARCPSVAVDPRFQLSADALAGNPQVQLFEQTSDSFFAGHDPIRLLRRPVDLAFLDGMHEFSFLLRDFIATERFCRRGSIILLHDCLPADDFMTRSHERVLESAPTGFPGWWTGDVWKIVPVLRAHRPDLQITCLDASPTGLVAVTRLDPRNATLADRYDRLIDQWRDEHFGRFGAARLLEVADVQACEAWLGSLKPFGAAAQVRHALRGARARVRQMLAA